MKYQVFDEAIEIYKNGKGLEDLIDKFELYYKSLLDKYNIACFDDEEDILQELRLITIEGFRLYNTDENSKLSTFLFVHIKNKFFSMIRKYKALKRNPSHLNDDNKRISYISSIDESLKVSGQGLVVQSLPSYATLYLPRDDIESANFRLSLSFITKKCDALTLSAIWGILEDKSIEEFAIDVSPWALSCRIKKISKFIKIEDFSYKPEHNRSVSSNSYIKKYAPLF